MVRKNRSPKSQSEQHFETGGKTQVATISSALPIEQLANASFLPSPEIVQEFARFYNPFMPQQHQVSTEVAARSLLDQKVHSAFSGTAPFLVADALHDALEATKIAGSIRSPIPYLKGVMRRHIEQHGKDLIIAETKRRALRDAYPEIYDEQKKRLLALARGELPTRSSLQESIALWNAKPMARSGIGYLTNDVIAEVAEEFIDLPPQAKQITTRHVRKAFEGSLGKVYVPEYSSRDATTAEIQDRARVRLRQAAFGGPEAQLQRGPLAAGIKISDSDHAAIPQALIDEMLASYSVLFFDDARKQAEDYTWGNRPEIDLLHDALRSFLSLLNRGTLPDLQPNLYGQGLQEKFEDRAREIAHKHCRDRLAKLEAERVAAQEHEEQVADAKWRREDERLALERFEKIKSATDPKLIVERKQLICRLPLVERLLLEKQ